MISNIFYHIILRTNLVITNNNEIFFKVDRRMTQTTFSKPKTNPVSVPEFFVNLIAIRRKQEIKIP